MGELFTFRQNPFTEEESLINGCDDNSYISANQYFKRKPKQHRSMDKLSLLRTGTILRFGHPNDKRE